MVDFLLICKAVGSHLKSFLSGGVGGIMAVLVGHPFDLGKFVSFRVMWVYPRCYTYRYRSR